jgi:lysophospholipase L1-like esterase
MNYGWFYITPYSDTFTKFKHKYYYGAEQSIYKTYPPNTSVNFVSKDFEILHNYNELGIRERNGILKLAENKKSILAIGDSFTEGVGTNQDSTWLRLLEYKLNKDFGNEYLTINAGISGLDPVSESYLLEYLLTKIKPDYVIISISSNDLIDIMQRGVKERYANNSTTYKNEPLGYYFYSWSYLFRVIASVGYDYPEMFMNKSEFNTEISKSSSAIYTIFEHLQDLGNKNGFKPIVVFYPGFNENLNLKYSFPIFDSLVEKSAEIDSIYTINLMDFYITNKDSLKFSKEKLYWKNDGHHTTLGYQVWSDILYSELIARKIIVE